MAVPIAVSELPQLGLEQHEYIDPAHYALELERFWRPGWRFVCHESEIAGRGQYVRYDLAGDSVIVVRGDEGASTRSTTSAATAARRSSPTRAAPAARGSCARSTAGRTTTTARCGRPRRCTRASTARAGT